MVTNWTQFRNTFGDYMVGPPRFYMAYAVKGFYDNGGTVAYIVRVSTGQQAFLDLADRGQNPGTALRVRAQREGPAGNNITVAVADAQIVPLAQNAVAHRDRAAIASASANIITLANIADAVRFRGGDTITIETTNERAVVDRVRGADLVLQTSLNVAHQPGDFVRIADLAIGQTTFRVDNNAGLEPGSVIQLSEQGGANEDQIVSAIAGDFITLSGAGLAHAYAMDQASNPVTVVSFEFSLTITSPPNAPENYFATA